MENTKTTLIPLEIIVGNALTWRRATAKNIKNMQPMLFHRIPVNRLEQHWATPCCIIYSCTIKNYRSLVSDTAENAERNKYLETYMIHIKNSVWADADTNLYTPISPRSSKHSAHLLDCYLAFHANLCQFPLFMFLSSWTNTVGWGCVFWLWGVYTLAEHAYTLAAH